jgi:hypothetical protein
VSNFTSFEELGCWKEASNLRLFVAREIVAKLPDFEKFGLMNQIKRSSRSVGNNIAEGYGRFHFQENILNELRIIHDKTLKILNGYIKYLKNQKET